jgi:hypothetical protein
MVSSRIRLACSAPQPPAISTPSTSLPNTSSTGPPYLDARSELVAELADQVRLSTEGEAPAWAAQPHSLVPAELIAEVQVATQVDLGDLRPTGPPSSAAPPKPGNSN